MLRRFSFFVLLGPLLSWLMFVAMLSPKLMTGPRFDHGLEFFAVALVVCYLFGAVPLLVVAGIDHLMSRYRWRLLVCAVVGFGTACAMFYYASRGGVEKDFQTYWFFLGLMGAIPAAIGSWLSGRKLVIRTC